MLEKSLEGKSSVVKVLIALGFSVLTGVAAQIRIPLFFTPVPITGQTFVVLLTPFLIGPWSVLSQTLYVALGVAGLPWFSGWKAGMSVLLGPTGGYLVGFVLASAFLSKFRAKSFMGKIASLILANFLIIHGLGLIQLTLWFYARGSNPDLWKLLSMSLLPFVPGDLVKIFLVSSIVTRSRSTKE
jgi:biotin transport system substrate-specific component